MTREQNTNQFIQAMILLFEKEHMPNPVKMKAYKDELSRYGWEDVMAACRHFDNNRHQYKIAATRWPYVGEIVDILKEWMIPAKDFGQAALPAARTSLDDAKAASSHWHHEWLVKQGMIVANEFNWLLADWKKENRAILDKFTNEKGAPQYATILALMWQQGIPQQFENGKR